MSEPAPMISPAAAKLRYEVLLRTLEEVSVAPSREALAAVMKRSLKYVVTTDGWRLIVCAADGQTELASSGGAASSSADAVAVPGEAAQRRALAERVEVCSDTPGEAGWVVAFAHETGGQTLGLTAWRGSGAFDTLERSQVRAVVRVCANRYTQLRSLDLLAEARGVAEQRAAALAHEIEERKLLESQLVQAQKLKAIGQLAAGIAHEINTPVQYVSANTQFLQQQISGILRVVDDYAAQLDPDSPPLSWQERAAAIRTTLSEVNYSFLHSEVPEALKESLEGLDRISNIVGAMRDFSHPGAEARGPADLNQAILATTTVCRNRWAKVAELSFLPDPSLPEVVCQVTQINQVILNLVVNAADSIAERYAGTAEKGTITLKTRLSGTGVEIRVTDNGLGVPNGLQQQIFDPFFTTKDVGQGTGQGLAISQDIVVQKHGGKLHYENTPGGGATFVIRLPLSPSASQPHAA
ncbi:MAG: ATP-binding protein [Planctomycetota bacterium]